MTYSIDDTVFNGNQFFEGNQDTQPRLDELRAIQAQVARGDDVIVGDMSARGIVEFIVKRAGYLGHRLIGDLIGVWAEALLQHVEDVADGNPLKYVNPNWDHPARVRDPQFRSAELYRDMQPEAVDPIDDGSKYPDGYRKPVTNDDVDSAQKELDRRKAEQESGNRPPQELPDGNPTPDGANESVSDAPQGGDKSGDERRENSVDDDDEIRRIMDL